MAGSQEATGAACTARRGGSRVPRGLRAHPPVESRGKAPSGRLGGEAHRFVPYYVLIDTRRSIQNRFITKLISVRQSGFALGRAVAVRLD